MKIQISILEKNNKQCGIFITMYKGLALAIMHLNKKVGTVFDARGCCYTIL